MSPPFFLAVRHENPWYNSKKRRRKGMTDRNLVGLFKDLKGQEWIVSHTDLRSSG